MTKRKCVVCHGEKGVMTAAYLQNDLCLSICLKCYDKRLKTLKKQREGKQ